MRNLMLKLRLKVIMQNQKLCWALSRPLKYMGLSIDEWGVVLAPGIVLLNSRHAKLGLAFMVGGIALCYCFKKFKKVSENFLLKSFLVAKGLLPAPLGYSRLLGKKVGK
ncbi:Uncharacterised protein [Orientia tsutsugamushi]|uniref:hypothetical protein n=1 Tax=Orientia tsutsugamushi TaxID=784 RepID=UPI00061F0370|nr:hypothetical protein [Orientia tsutsugamushi]KJV69774.1 hypothetical protein OTSTA763_3006 [Orientia tsutsugamushi str. TA763]SPP24529.1 Uncharacterised protein [Orientia tsutsugamushi]